MQLLRLIKCNMLIILLYRFKIKAIKLVIISSTKKKKLVIKFYLISNCVHKFIVTFIHVHSIYSASKISYSRKQFNPLNPYNLLSKIYASGCDQIICGGGGGGVGLHSSLTKLACTIVSR